MGLVPHLDHPDLTIGVILSYCSPDRNKNYHDRQCNPSHYDRRYNNSNGFSPARSYSQDRYPNKHQNRTLQDRYHGGYHRNRWINIITMVMIGTQHIRKSQFNNQQLFNRNNQTRQAYSNQPASSNGNDSYMGHSKYNSSCSLSDVSSFVTRDCVTFDSRRIQGFPNACTVN